MKKLKKELHLYDVYAICTGAMFSSGFFLLPGIAAAQTGESVYLAYLASGILIIPAMLSVAELSTAMPRSGGTYYFLDRSMGPVMGTIGGLGSWIALMFKSSFALIGMGAYLAIYLDMSFTLLAVVLTLLFGILNVFGAKETTLLQRILVTILVVIMGVFIIDGIRVLGTQYSWFDTSGGSESILRNGFSGFISTIGLVFVSYAGLTKVTSVAEEVKNPDRNIPLGMMLSLGSAAVIYVVGVYIMQAVLPADQFYSSLTPVADAAAMLFGWLPGGTGTIVIIIAAVAAFASTGNAGIMSASRYPFAMARDKLLSPKFSGTGKQGTPVFAITVTVLCMVAILLLFNVEAVAKLASAFQLLLFGLLCFSVIVMRESNIKSYQPGFKSPFYPWVQVAGMIISVWLVAEMGALAVFLTGLIIVCCVAWYFYYTKGSLSRRGAIFHVHQRLGEQRYEALEYELLHLINEKHETDKLSYREIIGRSTILETRGKNLQLTNILEEAAGILSGRTATNKRELIESFEKGLTSGHDKLGKRAVSYAALHPDIESPELVIFRLKPGQIEKKDEQKEPLNFIAWMLLPSHEEEQEIRLMGHLAEVIQSSDFNQRWEQAAGAKELRECLLSEGHFIHLKVADSEALKSFAGKKLSEIQLPGSCLLTLIYRGRDVIIPHGDTILKPSDEILLVADADDINQLIYDGDAKI